MATPATTGSVGGVAGRRVEHGLRPRPVEDQSAERDDLTRATAGTSAGERGRTSRARPRRAAGASNRRRTSDPQQPQPGDGLHRHHAVAHQRASRNRRVASPPSATSNPVAHPKGLIRSTSSPSTSSSQRSELDADSSTVLSPSTGRTTAAVRPRRAAPPAASDRSRPSPRRDPAVRWGPPRTTGRSARIGGPPGCGTRSAPAGTSSGSRSSWPRAWRGAPAGTGIGSSENGAGASRSGTTT